MGNWYLEVARMTLYMAFPVTCFHIFNQPEYFEKWVTETKRQMYPPDHKTYKSEIKQLIKEVQEMQDRERMAALNESVQK